VEDHLIPSHRPIRGEFGGYFADGVIRGGDQDELGLSSCFGFAPLM
jgi:hypothetical protein